MKLAEIDKDADLLTTVLNVLQFKGRCFCYSQFTAPWALKLPESDFAHFHVCEGGQAWIEVEGVERPALMAAGDLVIRPHGNAHVIQDDPKSIALNHLLKWRSPGTNLVRHGGGGTETIGVCGSFKFENEVGNPIISLLPKLIHVSHKDTQTCIWLEPILKGWPMRESPSKMRAVRRSQGRLRRIYCCLQRRLCTGPISSRIANGASRQLRVCGHSSSRMRSDDPEIICPQATIISALYWLGGSLKRCRSPIQDCPTTDWRDTGRC
jgi:Cupin